MKTKTELDIISIFRKQFDVSAAKWDLEASDPNCYFTHRIPFVAELVTRYARGSKCLDVGCAAGAMCFELAKRGMDVYGTDLSEVMISATRKRLGRIVNDAEHRFKVSISGEIPFEGDRFDVITVLWTLPYVPNRSRYLESLILLLNPGGCLVASNINRGSLHTMASILRYLMYFRPNSAWAIVLNNLWRTGFWTGGALQDDPSEDITSAARFDGLMARVGLQLIDEVNFYCLQPSRFHLLDRKPLARTTIGQRLSRHFAWEHVGVFRV